MANRLFDIPVRNDKQSDLVLAKKSKAKVAKTSTTIKGGGGIVGRINQIKTMVDTNLGQYKDKYQIIQQEELLHDFITECIGNSYISIDTETTGLDPLLDTLVGICPYTYGQKGSYIPLNHVSYITNEKVDGQLSMEFVMSEFKRLLDKKPDIDMFNASFDIRVMRANGLSGIYCTWDGFLASKILNENELEANLKALHNKYCLGGKGSAFRFDDLFKGIPFSMIPIQVGYLYAANDPVITTELCDYQRQHLRLDHEREDMRNIAWVFHNIEMPCVQATCDLEDAGIEIDLDYNEQLKIKYHALLNEKIQGFYDSCVAYTDVISEYRLSVGDGCKLENPINIASTTQLAILFYDILGLPLYYDKKTKKNTRSTSEDALVKLNHPVADAVLEYRKLATLVSTFIDKLPECINPNDGRIHCSFNQYGAATGRYSSSEPNLQNIPSRNHDIRKMFKATDGYVLLSADYSQQEIKGMAQMCGDEGMIEAFRQGKDFYAEIASVAFKQPYKECLEHFPKGSYIKQKGDKWYYGTEDDYDKIADGEKDTYADGKERRSQAKAILLGINYGRGATSIAEQVGCTKEEAERIKNDVFTGFPAIAEFERQSYRMVEELGYITTLWGRKRRLPSMLLPDYEVVWLHSTRNIDILNFVDDIELEVPRDVQDYFISRISKCKFKEKSKIMGLAESKGYKIIDHTKDKDYTKVVNARIQGTAADMTKLAMTALCKNQRLKELGFRMLIQVHDEIIAECPRENAKEVIPLFAKVMSEAPGEKFVVPISCDVEVAERWYGDKIDIDDL